MAKLRTIVSLVVIAFILGMVTGVSFIVAFQSLIQSSTQVENVGIIRVIGVEVYQDENLTDPLEVVNWGIIGAGESKDFNITWIKNVGNDNQRLVMWTESWNPQNASNWIALTWDYDGLWIPVNGTIPVVFTLSVDSNITNITNFSFDIWIKGVH